MGKLDVREVERRRDDREDVPQQLPVEGGLGDRELVEERVGERAALDLRVGDDVRGARAALDVGELAEGHPGRQRRQPAARLRPVRRRSAGRTMTRKSSSAGSPCAHDRRPGRARSTVPRRGRRRCELGVGEAVEEAVLARPRSSARCLVVAEPREQLVLAPLEREVELGRSAAIIVASSGTACRPRPRACRRRPRATRRARRGSLGPARSTRLTRRRSITTSSAGSVPVEQAARDRLGGHEVEVALELEDRRRARRRRGSRPAAPAVRCRFESRSPSAVGGADRAPRSARRAGSGAGRGRGRGRGRRRRRARCFPARRAAARRRRCRAGRAARRARRPRRRSSPGCRPRRATRRRRRTSRTSSSR